MNSNPMYNNNTPVDQGTLRTMRDLLAKVIIEQLRDPEAAPGVMQAALRFLSDYDEAGLPVTGSGLTEQPPFGDNS